MEKLPEVEKGKPLLRTTAGQSNPRLTIEAYEGDKRIRNKSYVRGYSAIPYNNRHWQSKTTCFREVIKHIITL